MFRNWPRERQIEFPALQSHHPLLTPVLLVLSLVCIAVVVIIVLTRDDGPFIGPWG
jgi:hypothetical protein